MPPGSPPGAVSAPVKGILLSIIAWQIMPFMDATAKHLTQFYPIVQLVWARFFFHFLFVAPMVLVRYGPAGFRVPRAGLQVLRGGFLLISTALYFTSIRTLPLANAIALIFIAPIGVTLLAPLLLKERVPATRWLAVLIGFVAVLIIVRPGLHGFDWASLLAIGAALSFSLYLLSTRLLAGSAPPLVTLAYQSILGMVVTCAILPFVWVTPTPVHFLMLVAIGAIAAGGHFLVVQSYEYADASLLAPSNYTEIIMATTLGYLFFGNFPDVWTGVGILLIVATAVWISLPGRRRAV